MKVQLQRIFHTGIFNPETCCLLCGDLLSKKRVRNNGGVSIIWIKKRFIVPDGVEKLVSCKKCEEEYSRYDNNSWRKQIGSITKYERRVDGSNNLTS